MFKEKIKTVIFVFTTLFSILLFVVLFSTKGFSECKEEN